MSLPSILPPIQYALLYSVGAASLLFVLLRTIRDMTLKAKTEEMQIQRKHENMIEHGENEIQKQILKKAER